MEYNIDSFTERLRQLMRDNFPHEPEDISKRKHPKRNGLQLRDMLDDNHSLITVNIDTRTFDLGSPMLEALAPHYHILQNSEIIKKRNRGTKTSKGSQGAESNLMLRDYERVSWNGKTFTKEYNKNVRGTRSKANKILEPKLKYVNGAYVEDTTNVSAYVNIHYKYLDRILDAIVPYLAQEFGLRAMRKQDTGLKEEFEMQQNEDFEENYYSIYDTIESFME